MVNNYQRGNRVYYYQRNEIISYFFFEHGLYFVNRNTHTLSSVYKKKNYIPTTSTRIGPEEVNSPSSSTSNIFIIILQILIEIAYTIRFQITKS